MDLANRLEVSTMGEYQSLYQRSLDDPEGFWGEAAEALHWHKRWDQVLDPATKWGSARAASALRSNSSGRMGPLPDELRQVLAPDGKPAVGDGAGDIEQAAAVSGKDPRGPGREDVIDLVVHHGP